MTTEISNSSKKHMLETIEIAVRKCGLPPLGKGFTRRDGNREALRFGRRETGQYYVTHEWTIPESYDDDHESQTGGLIQGRPTRSATVEADTLEDLRAKLAD